MQTFHSMHFCITVDFDANGLAKQVNAVQKEIAAKKKVGIDLIATCACN